MGLLKSKLLSRNVHFGTFQGTTDVQRFSFKCPWGHDVGARAEGLGGSHPGSAIMGRLIRRAEAMPLPAPPRCTLWLLQTDMPSSSPAKLAPHRSLCLFVTWKVGCVRANVCAPSKLKGINPLLFPWKIQFRILKPPKSAGETHFLHLCLTGFILFASVCAFFAIWNNLSASMEKAKR